MRERKRERKKERERERKKERERERERVLSSVSQTLDCSPLSANIPFKHAIATLKLHRISILPDGLFEGDVC